MINWFKLLIQTIKKTRRLGSWITKMMTSDSRWNNSHSRYFSRCKRRFSLNLRRVMILKCCRFTALRNLKNLMVKLKKRWKHTLNKRVLFRSSKKRIRNSKSKLIKWNFFKMTFWRGEMAEAHPFITMQGRESNCLKASQIIWKDRRQAFKSQNQMAEKFWMII